MIYHHISCYQYYISIAFRANIPTTKFQTENILGISRIWKRWKVSNAIRCSTLLVWDNSQEKAHQWSCLCHKRYQILFWVIQGYSPRQRHAMRALFLQNLYHDSKCWFSIVRLKAVFYVVFSRPHWYITRSPCLPVQLWIVFTLQLLSQIINKI